MSTSSGAPTRTTTTTGDGSNSAFEKWVAFNVCLLVLSPALAALVIFIVSLFR